MGGSACSGAGLVVALALCIAALSPLVAAPAVAQTSVSPVAPASVPASAPAPARCGPDDLCDVLPLVTPNSATQATDAEALRRAASGRARAEPAGSNPSLRLPAELCLLKPRREVQRCLDGVFRGIPEYQEAVLRRRAGAELIAFGAGGGGGLMTLAAVMAGFENWCLLGACPRPDYTKEKIMAGIGAAMFAIGLAVGIPLYVSGTSARDAIRARYLGGPIVSMGAGPGQGLVSAWWLF